MFHPIPCSQVKNLGVIFNKHFTWDDHVGAVSRRCNDILIGLSQTRRVMPRNIVSVLVSALVVSQVRYCLSVYSNGTQTSMNRIQRILNFAAKVVYGRSKFERASDLLDELGWLPAQLMADHSTICLAHKVLVSGEPRSLAATLVHNRDSRQRSTRKDGLLYVPRSRCEAGKRRFCVRVPALYNALPDELTSMNPWRFSRTLKRKMIPLTTQLSIGARHQLAPEPRAQDMKCVCLCVCVFYHYINSN